MLKYDVFWSHWENWWVCSTPMCFKATLQTDSKVRPCLQLQTLGKVFVQFSKIARRPFGSPNSLKKKEFGACSAAAWCSEAPHLSWSIALGFEVTWHSITCRLISSRTDTFFVYILDLMFKFLIVSFSYNWICCRLNFPRCHRTRRHWHSYTTTVFHYYELNRS